MTKVFDRCGLPQRAGTAAPISVRGRPNSAGTAKTVGSTRLPDQEKGHFSGASGSCGVARVTMRAAPGAALHVLSPGSEISPFQEMSLGGGFCPPDRRQGQAAADRRLSPVAGKSGGSRAPGDIAGITIDRPKGDRDVSAQSSEPRPVKEEPSCR